MQYFRRKLTASKNRKGYFTRETLVPLEKFSNAKTSPLLPKKPKGDSLVFRLTLQA